MRLAALLFCISTVGLANSWSGFLVDSRCWESRQNNVSQDTSTASRDMDGDVRYCSPRAHTTKFAVIQHDWTPLKLDSDGNTEAAELVQHGKVGCVTYVYVTGTVNHHTIRVHSISAPPVTRARR